MTPDEIFEAKSNLYHLASEWEQDAEASESTDSEWTALTLRSCARELRDQVEMMAKRWERKIPK